MNTRLSCFGALVLCVSAALAAAAPVDPQARQCPPEIAPPPADAGGRTVVPGTAQVPVPGGEKLVYGTDDRLDVYQETNPTRKALAGSVCALLHTYELTHQSGGGWHISTNPYTFSGLPACASEPFANQPTSAFCTGFLVGPDIVATAGHCYDAGDYASTRFVFGFEMKDAATPETNVAENQVYTGVSVLGHQLDSTNKLDYAIVQLDRAVTAPGAVPLSIRRTGTVPLDTAVGVIGYPDGLPKKIAFGATTRVSDNTAAGYFIANLDTYGGNSGSPVFNADTSVVEGILVRGNTDFKVKGDCFVSNTLPDSTPDAEEVSKATTFSQFVPELGGKGEVVLDHDLYSCAATLGITLTDTNAAGAAQQVTVTSGAGDTETVTLTEKVAGSHAYTGSIPLSAEAVTAQNGTLSVADGTTISVLYSDPDNGAGAQENITATAMVDCAAPEITGVTFIPVNGTSEAVQFQTSETATGAVAWAATNCHDAGAVVVPTASGTSHSAMLTGLSPGIPYFVTITATDAAGNSATSDNSGNCHTFTASSAVVGDGGLELGNVNPVWTQGSTAYGTVICSAAQCGLGSTSGAFEGAWWIWFGGVEGKAEDAYAAQSVTIPDSVSALLTFQLEIPAAHVPGYLRVLMDGDQLFQITQSDAATYAAYRQVAISVSAYADGAAHMLRFEGHTDGSAATGITSFFVDNVAIAPSDEGEPAFQITVPGVEGLAQSAAESTLRLAGLTAQVSSRHCSDIFPAGQVISQTPASNAFAARGSTVSLVVSTGSCAVTQEGEGEGEPTPVTQMAQALYDGFVAADANHDGLLSVGEAQAAQPELTTADFINMDINGDGTISQDELTAYLGTGTGCVCAKSNFTFGGLQKSLGDFFLGALGLAVLALSAGRHAR